MFKVPYLVEKSHKGKLYRYWQPKSKYLVAGEMHKCPFPSYKFSPIAISDKDNTLGDVIMKCDELYRQLEKWRSGGETKLTHDHGTVGWLITEYKKDERFTRLESTTQKTYLLYFEKLMEISDLPVSGITRMDAREIYKSYVDGSTTAGKLAQHSRILFNFGKDIGLITINPWEDMRIPKPKARQTIIPKEIIEQAVIKANEMGLTSIGRSIMLGYHAGQRPGDIRLLPRNNYDGKWLTVSQNKTKAKVFIPVYKLPELKKALDGISQDSILFLHEERTGNPYSKDMLCRRVREVFIAAGIGSEYQFRDLRRTAVVRLAEAGCEIPEICAITGHKLKEATQILEVYLPRTRRMAENALDKVVKLEKAQD